VSLTLPSLHLVLSSVLLKQNGVCFSKNYIRFLVTVLLLSLERYQVFKWYQIIIIILLGLVPHRKIMMLGSTIQFFLYQTSLFVELGKRLWLVVSSGDLGLLWLWLMGITS